MEAAGEIAADKLVASPHWEWRPGMLLRGSEGPRERVTLRIRDGEHSPEQAAIFADAWRPDLDDDATCGVLLGLVRKAWGFCVVEITIHEDGSATIAMLDAIDGSLVRAVHRDTLGQALEAALLAAPPPRQEPSP